MERFQILTGLPPTGDLPEQFSASGRGTHREGLVVQFFPEGKTSWVGNFQGGAGCHDVLQHPDGKSLIVIASGRAYVIDPTERRLLTTFGGDIDGVLVVPQANLLVLSRIVRLEAWDKNGKKWTTRRISWDGIWDLRIENDKVKGEAWTPIGEKRYPFSVDLWTGAVAENLDPQLDP